MINLTVDLRIQEAKLSLMLQGKNSNRIVDISENWDLTGGSPFHIWSKSFAEPVAGGAKMETNLDNRCRICEWLAQHSLVKVAASPNRNELGEAA